ncbi:N-acetylmuramoyl-L-alanine amidase [Tropicibacter naphthalenivorans]|uniref:N-acetylmuramoyl-L-alanine amidase n=1 Tax=Tropicibacter naphthalenivorans TaxID=441103 RepID=A0A0P1GMF0_9RHOB|nr:N-acetylmuramoyl-L-alanine amidase [Tropicibacter naphthalenivorans]CUH76509.1 N-acetylmuramoyl-L-alanine amidase AmiD precursor [Tropicibacter naphthalenivorans]SMC65721.1 N-acetylmuramoyl-L-alanine amidase [Tropicibacter naphthalenivorans]
MVVLHYTAMDSAEGARDWLCNPQAEVSAHYVLAEDGRLWQLVREADRAWHAGAGSWGACADVNSASVGIEIANTGYHPFPEPQISVLEQLLAGILQRWSIRPERVVGHSDTALGRKIDPGGRFDWRRLARRGLAVWPEGRAEPGDFYRDAVRFGYAPDAAEDDVLRAFRMRFRPWADGPLTDEDASLMAELAAKWPAPAATA